MTDLADRAREATREERADRNLGELLSELRVALPGVQVLFAFLLVVPVQPGFHTDDGLRAQALLRDPAVHGAGRDASDRSLHPPPDPVPPARQEHLVLSANRLTIAGLAVLALAMTSAVLLITHILFGGVTAGVTGAAVLLAFALLSYAVPLRRRSGQADRQ